MEQTQKLRKLINPEELLTPEESELLRPPKKITVSEWAAEYRVLPTKSCANPGKWCNEFTPYLVGIMDAFCDRDIETVGFVKPTQIGGTEALYNAIGYFIMQDPGPLLLVMPTEAEAKKAFRIRIKPLIDESKELPKYKTSDPDDFSQQEIRLTSMNIFPAWANSPATLSSFPMKDVILDEVGKFPKLSGKEANPVKLGEERLTSYKAQGRAKLGILSTPGEEGDVLWTQANIPGTVKLYFWVPCPECGKRQILDFHQIKRIDGIADPEIIKRDKKARYECIHCKKDIPDTKKREIMLQGIWATKDAKFEKGKWINEKKSDRVFFFINCLYSPFRTWPVILAEWFRSYKVPDLHRNFINSWLGEWWTPGERHVKIVIKDRKVDYFQGNVPEGAAMLTAFADSQATCFYYVIRAWGPKEVSWLIRHGMAQTVQELDKDIFETLYYFPGQTAALGVHCCGWDTAGGRESDVYNHCRESKYSYIPCKGQQTCMPNLKFSQIEYHYGTKANLLGGIKLCHLNTTYFKDNTYKFINAKVPQWFIPQDIDEDYLTQMVSEQKVIDTKKSTGRFIERWITIPEGAANHYWDCEVGNIAMAELKKLRFNLKDDKDKTAWLSAQSVVTPQERPEPDEKKENFVNKGKWKGW